MPVVNMNLLLPVEHHPVHMNYDYNCYITKSYGLDCQVGHCCTVVYVGHGHVDEHSNDCALSFTYSILN